MNALSLAWKSADSHGIPFGESHLADKTSSPATILKIESNTRRRQIAGAIVTSDGVICATNFASVTHESGHFHQVCRRDHPSPYR
jgi:hypothetical protein